MNIKSMLTGVKAALRLSAVRRCFSFRKNDRTGELMEIVKIRGEKYCAVAIEYAADLVDQCPSYKIRYIPLHIVKTSKKYKLK